MVTARHRNGYTLIEIMLTVAIMAIVATAVPRLFTNVYRFMRLSVARAEIQKNARMTLSNINRALRQARASSIVVDQLSGMPPYSRIAFSRYKPDGSTEDVSYYQNGNNLYLSVGGAGGRMVAEDLRYIAFSYPQSDDSTIISISVSFERATYEGGTKALQMAIEKVRVMN